MQREAQLGEEARFCAGEAIDEITSEIETRLREDSLASLASAVDSSPVPQPHILGQALVGVTRAALDASLNVERKPQQFRTLSAADRALHCGRYDRAVAALARCFRYRLTGRWLLRHGFQTWAFQSQKKLADIAAEQTRVMQTFVGDTRAMLARQSMYRFAGRAVAC